MYFCLYYYRGKVKIDEFVSKAWPAKKISLCSIVSIFFDFSIKYHGFLINWSLYCV